MNEQDRQAYWDNYINYWLKRVEDSNTNTNNEDKMADDSVMEGYITLLTDSLKNELGGGQYTILDYGCGFGRSYPYFEKLNCLYYGCDIAQSCIDYMLSHYPNAQAQKLLPNDSIPFEKQKFDGIFCYGVFDACFQHITIFEILSRLKTGGIALITGKNNNYLESDEMALVAEIGARKNNHPNYFTDTPLLLNELQKRKVKILQSRFFLERKDGATDTYTTTMPERFYTYALLLQVQENSILEPFTPFSHTHSKTFELKNKHL